jgi:hypothetical protein
MGRCVKGGAALFVSARRNHTPGDDRESHFGGVSSCELRSDGSQLS